MLEKLPNLPQRFLQVADNYPYSAALLSGRQEARTPYHQYDYLLAIGTQRVYAPFGAMPGAWTFGSSAYESRHVELGIAAKLDTNFQNHHWFRAEVVLTSRQGKVDVHYEDEAAFAQLSAELQNAKAKQDIAHPAAVFIGSSYSKGEYIEAVERVRYLIREGDVYQLNLCNRFLYQIKLKKPAMLFKQLYQLAPHPFSAYLKLENTHILSTRYGAAAEERELFSNLSAH